MPSGRVDGYDRVGARIVVAPALSNEIPGIALEPDEIGYWPRGTGSGISTASRHSDGQTEHHTL